MTAACQPRHRHQEFLRFLKQVARTYPDRQLHLVMDNYATHKRAEVRTWLEANPRVQVHFTPTSASWMNLVEVWFGIIERQAIRRGTFGSVTDLNTKSAPSSTTGTTTAPTRSLGPRPPTKSSRKRTVKQLQTRDTREPDHAGTLTIEQQRAIVFRGTR